MNAEAVGRIRRKVLETLKQCGSWGLTAGDLYHQVNLLGRVIQTEAQLTGLLETLLEEGYVDWRLDRVTRLKIWSLTAEGAAAVA